MNKEQSPQPAKTRAERAAAARAELDDLAREAAAAEAHQERVRAFNQALIGLGGPVVGTLNTLQALVYDWNAAQGFWASDNTGEKIALMHSELSEALEADRKAILSDDKIPSYTGVEAELADTVIRILDFAGRRHLRLGEAIIEKLSFNTTRPFKHGKGY
jgi:hypothetical protein